MVRDNVPRFVVDMIGYLFKKIFGTKNDREVKKLRGLVAQINTIEESLQSLSDDALREKTAQWKAEISAIEDYDERAAALEKILPEAFVVVKNACRRLVGKKIIVREQELTWDMIPFDVQLIGGIALHRGMISEMATGEGKTLVATLPLYLNALSGRGSHLVTVNDYLALRDSEWMGTIFKFLGLTVGCILHDQPPQERRAQYACDITYGTNAEFGFDYLRDNGMAVTASEQVQRGYNFAIVDEVDSILIDEARVPLIISGPSVIAFDNKLYEQFKPRIANLVEVQRRHCAGYLEQVKKLQKRLEEEKQKDSHSETVAELRQEIGLLLYRTKIGAPKMPAFLSMMEDPDNMRLVNDTELELHSDQTKKALYAQKEELYFAVDEKGHDADLTEKGRNYMQPDDPDAFVLPDTITAFHDIDVNPEYDAAKKMQLKGAIQQEFENKSAQIHVISQLLKAYCLFEKDVQYVVQNNKVIIVDEHTGRLMTGRRWSDGLHQAVEAKEGVEIERETQTLATITIQNYFRLYKKLAGMTGTAETEANEFFDIYKLKVLVIPTNRTVARKDANDSVYKTQREKYNAVVNEIVELHRIGRPILVGTRSVESSEFLSHLLRKVNIPHSVLNAKHHQQEAEIVARAGQRGAVTIATNMAGRGTDIKLGEGVAELGGLHVIGTERHESRRIDRQLRGRCARQGDPGSSHFFISLEDDVMRLFGSDRIIKVMEKVGLEEGQELNHPLLNRSIQTAQKRVEQHHYQIRKRTLEYDDVMNKQREIVYGFRNEIIHSEDVQDRLLDVMEEVLIQKVQECSDPDQDADLWNMKALLDWVNLHFPLSQTPEKILEVARQGTEKPIKDSLYGELSAQQFAVAEHLVDAIRDAYMLKASFENPAALRSVERYTILSAIDRLWQEHLYHMDHLRNAISLRAYGQRDPLLEYKAEAYKTFDKLMMDIKTQICHNIFRSASSLMAFQQFLQNLSKSRAIQTSGGEEATIEGGSAAGQQQPAAKPQPIRRHPRVGRNDPCPCGSGKKFKHCCGILKHGQQQ